MVQKMLKINQEKHNSTYHPILDNYEQFANLSKVTPNVSNLDFAHPIHIGKIKQFFYF